MIRKLLSLYIGICTALVLIVQGLSLFHAIALLPLLVCVMVVALGALILMRPRLNIRSILADFTPRLYTRRISPAILPLAVTLPIIALISFALGWHVPPNNWDSMTYHLSRAAYWRQWHSLAHFPTNNWRQDAFPGNAEVLLLVTLLVAHSAKLAFLVQYTSYLAAIGAVYGLSRQLRLGRTFAFVAAGAFATMPEVVLQSMSTQNDLTVAAFVACSVFFFIDAVQEHNLSSMVLMAAALGLAIGTKPTAILAMPGLLAGAAVILWSRRQALQRSRRGLLAITGALLVAVFTAAPWYVANETYYGYVSGPPVVAQTQQVAHPSLETLRTNILRYLVAFIDPEGPALLTTRTATAVCVHTADLRAKIIAATRNPVDEPAIEWPGAGYSSAPPCTYNEDLSWFGLAGWCAIMIALAWVVGALLARRISLAWMLAIGAVSFIACASLLLRWSPWQGRLVITAMALAAPLLGVLAARLSQLLSGRLILQLAILYAALTGFSAAINNTAKPISAWNASSTAMQFATRPEMGDVTKRVAQTLASSAPAGLFLSVDDWDYPLFGPDLDRQLEPLSLEASTKEYSIPPTLLPYVITHQSVQNVTALLQRLNLHCTAQWTEPHGSGAPWQVYRCLTR